MVPAYYGVAIDPRDSLGSGNWTNSVMARTSLAAFRRTGHLKKASRNVTTVPVRMGGRAAPKCSV